VLFSFDAPGSDARFSSRAIDDERVGMTSELWLIRHGETEWSAAGKHTGVTDLALTEQGSEVAASLRERLASVKFDRVIVSPLLRARQTCELAGFCGRGVIEPDLHEWRYGEYEGLTTPQIREGRSGWTVWKDGPLGGESHDDVAARADRIILAVRGGTGRVAAFCHGHISRVIGARWIGHPVSEGARLRLDTAAICILGWERETAVIKLWNDVGRLPA
jgi:broad specificity phosphatase PhoE